MLQHFGWKMSLGNSSLERYRKVWISENHID